VLSHLKLFIDGVSNMVYIRSTIQMNSTSFSTLDIGRALDIPRERLRDWMNRRFVQPTVNATGQGRKAVFTRSDVYGIAFFRTLIESGFSREVAADYVRLFLEREKNEPDHQKTVRIVFKIRVKHISVMTFPRTEGKWMDLETGWTKMEETGALPPEGWRDKDWQMIQIVNFEALCKKVDAALANL
jgi:hypothetical protein